MNLVKDQNYYFQRMLAGSPDALFEIIELERYKLFDFGVRLKGGTHVVVESLERMGKGLHGRSFAHVQKLRMAMYSFVRVQVAKSRTSEVRHLNSGDPVSSPTASSIHQVDEDAARMLETALDRCPQAERECVVLKFRFGFSDTEVSQIVGADEEDIRSKITSGIEFLKKVGLGDEHDYEALVAAIPYYPMPDRSAHSSIALSEMMSELKSHSAEGYPLWIWFGLGFVLVLIALYFLL